MMARNWPVYGWILLFCAALLLGACSTKEDPLAALNAQADVLIAALQGQQSGKVLAILHPEFTAQENLGQDWVRQTMTAMFLRYRDIRIHVVQREARLFPGAREAAEIKGRVVLVGAEGLLPQEGDYVEVTSEWRQDEGVWKLFRIRWQ